MGKVKTRLAATVGDEKAFAIYLKLASHTREVALQTACDRVVYYSDFIDVVAELKNEFPSINAVIVGEGPEKEMHQKKIIEEGLASNVKLSGSMPHQEVLKYLSQSKILLHTSTYEGSSGVIMEALYSGCFVVTSISVSLNPVKNIELATNLNEMTTNIAALLRNKQLEHERIIYNTMKNSTEKIISLFGL